MKPNVKSKSDEVVEPTPNDKLEHRGLQTSLQFHNPEAIFKSASSTSSTDEHFHVHLKRFVMR